MVDLNQEFTREDRSIAFNQKMIFLSIILKRTFACHAKLGYFGSFCPFPFVNLEVSFFIRFLHEDGFYFDSTL